MRKRQVFEIGYDADGDIDVDAKIFNQLNFLTSTEVILLSCLQLTAEEIEDSTGADLNELKIPELNRSNPGKN